MTEYEFHPLCEMFPLMSETELTELAADIKKNGQLENGIIFEGKILDGRNRYLACKRAGVDFVAHDMDPDSEDAVSVVFSRNVLRRHLSSSQRSMFASERFTEGSSALTIEAVAKAAKVSRRSVVDANRVRKHGSEKLNKSVKSGKIPVDKAASITKLPKKDQDKILSTPQSELKKKLKEHQRPKSRMPFSAYTVEPTQKIEKLGPNPNMPQIPPVTDGPSAAKAVQVIYERNKSKWNQIPPPAPLTIIDTIIKALEYENDH